MQATWYERTGPARDVLVVGEMLEPQPEPGSARVRLTASTSALRRRRSDAV
jgi:NADPH:quinone reductase